MQDRVTLGAEVFLEEHLGELKSKTVGFITNHTGLTHDLKPLINVFIERGLKIGALFGPEHGIRGEVADGAIVSDGKDPKTGIPVFSLYGKDRKPTVEMLNGLDALIFDIQDVGARFYTFLWTMAHCLEAAAEHGLPLWVLDRPNPITGSRVEGPVLDPKFASFVGLYPVTTRTGMTMGEVAHFVARRLEQGPAALRVVKMRGWKRSQWWDETGLPWVMPSPGMPTPETATVYTGMCLFEGTNVSEGRGMTRPFETIGAPWIDAEELAEAANALKLPGCLFRGTHFVPWFSKYKDTPCSGIQVHVTGRNAFEPVRTGLELLILIRTMYPKAFQFRLPPPSGNYSFDRLAGGDSIRKMIEDGANAGAIMASWKKDQAHYMGERAKCLLYEE
mgnify:CR=1 FL=1|jgi:uncharacterized protein YbbC (DUF1343 family)